MADAAVQVAVYKMGLDTADYQRGQQVVDTGNEQIIDSFSRLEAKYDPLVRAEQRRSAAIQQASRFLQEGQVTQERFAQQVARVNTFYDRQGVAAGGAANQNRASGFAMQNAAFQAADLAVQLQMGTNVLRAITQQGSQFLGIFGPWGAVVGAAVAVIGALATGLLGLGDASDDAAKAINTYGDALEESNKLLRTSKELTQELTTARKADAEFALRDAILVEQATISTLESIAAKRREYFQEIQESIPSTAPQSGVPSDVGAGSQAAIAGAQRRLGVLQQQLENLNTPELLGEAREEVEKAGERAAKEAEREAEQRERGRQTIEEQIDALFREARQIGMTSTARAADVELQKAEATARRAGIELTDAEIISVQAAAEAKQQAADAAEALKDAERERLRMVKELEREQKRAAKELERDLERQTDLLLDQGDAIRDLIDGTFDWRDAMVDAITTILNELAKLETFGGKGGGMFGAGGILGGLLGILGSTGSMFPGGVGAPAAGGGILSGMFAAEGGSGVVDKPTLFLAGEKGREKFKFTPAPRSDEDGGGSVMYQINIAGDADEAKIERVLTRHIPRIVRASEARVMKRARTSVGGSAALAQ